MKLEDDRRYQILEAAKACFFQYGFARTRMEDIARAASISRSNLYNFFDNKEAIFVAVGKHLFDLSIERAGAALQQDGDIWTRVLAAFEGWAVEHMEMVQASPHADELLGTVSALAQPLKDSYYERLADLLTQALRRAARAGEIDLTGALAGAGGNAASTAAMLIAASSGFKIHASTVAMYRKHLRGLIDMLRRATRAA